MTPLEQQMTRLGWDLDTLVDHLRRQQPDADRELALAREQQAKLNARITELEFTAQRR